jgi:hypothetical protein
MFLNNNDSNKKNKNYINFDDLPIFWINMDENIERRRYIENQLHNKKNIRIPGIVGKDINNDSYINYSKNNVFCGKKMTSSEIGCLLSHIKLFEISLKEYNYDYIIAIEDDVDMQQWMNQDTKEYLCNNINNFECIQLCIITPKYFTLPDNIPILLDWKEYNKKFKPGGCFWSAGCYIISRKARLKLINYFYNECLTGINKITPADFFIYDFLDTKTLFPPIIGYNYLLKSTIQIDYAIHKISHDRISKKYYNNNKLILISVWFGTFPDYLDLWLFTLKNANYDVLFITDQDLINYPHNLKLLKMSFSSFNNIINQKTGFNVNIKNVNKIVDVKPLFGLLFIDYIFTYKYWGWSDIDMMMGDILKDVINEDYDIYSYGFASFGPIMFFKIDIVDIYQHLENYENILNDPYICKVDEPWWFINNKKTDELQLYKDQGINVKYYSGKNLLDFIKDKKVYIYNWNTRCSGINWNIKNDIKLTKQEIWNYEIINNKILKNNIEINHSHLTLLKHVKNFSYFIKNNIINSTNNNFSIIIDYKYNNECLDNLTCVEVYNKYTDISFKINN